MPDGTNDNLLLDNLRYEYMKNPMGIDVEKPRFSWEIKSSKRGVIQKAYRLICGETSDALESGESILWDTGKVLSESSIHCRYDGPPLQTGRRYFWKVQAWDNYDNVSEWSPAAWFETGLMHKSDWKAKWIEPRLPEIKKEKGLALTQTLSSGKSKRPKEERLTPCTMLRKEFTAREGVKRARVYATAHGIYSLEINGVKIGDREFAPEFTAYDKLICYQTYDVTNMVAAGENAIGVIIADGWYGGRIGMTGESCQYGNKHALLLQMEIEFEDGHKEYIISDENFKCSTGPLVYSDIFIGEKYDARLEKEGWSSPGCDLSGWTSVDTADYGYDNVAAQYGEPVRRVMEIQPINILTTPKRETVIDLGQVIAGRVRMKVSGAPGTMVVLEHSEVLDEHGNFLNNIAGRNKDQEDIYILKGGTDEIYEPHFTFHGFRYVKVTGYPGEPKLSDFTGVVISSDMQSTGSFECSNLLINRLQQNIVWSQRANMISIPTDCPQRERAGWTGDIQVFAPTASFNMNVEAFLTRWLKNVTAEQFKDGQIPIIVPYIKAYRESIARMLGTDSTAGWGDACIIVPLTLYRKYGDIGILEDMYEPMVRWMDYVQKTAATKSPLRFRLNLLNRLNKEKVENEKYLWNTGYHWGDWLIPSKTMSGATGMISSALATKNTVASGYFAYTTGLMAEIADILGKSEDKNKYLELNAKIKKAFADRYIDRDGKLKPSLQGIYVLALRFGLVPDNLKQKALSHLTGLIKDNGYRLDTGFLSVPFLMDILCDNGHKDLAYRLLYQDECPSWLYEIKNGATTMWESWKAIQPNGKVTNVSYNHYAFGCIGDWMYRTIGGLNMLEAGYKKALIKPDLDCKLTSASAALETVYGTLSNSWEVEDGKVNMKVEVPANTTATIVLPMARKDMVMESGTCLSEGDGIYNISEIAGGVSIEAGSGVYEFSYALS